MDASDLAQQVDSGIDQLHCLFDEIGVSNDEREARESELFAALSNALNDYLRHVAAEKKELINEAKKTIIEIRQMETSLQDPKHARGVTDDEEFKIAFPLMRCLQGLREKHAHVARLHRERFEQVMKLAEALESYSSHLEPTFVQLALPPIGPNRSVPLNFDLSPSYVGHLDSEFTRVYEEYSRRLAAVQALGEHITQLWAELGIPQAQQDAAILRYHRDAPEQLGLHEQDIKRLTLRRDKLSEEKKNREKRLRDLRAAVEVLWEKLEVAAEETEEFLERNKGCGIRQINEFEAELERLNEAKRKNLSFFIEDARVTLQELWDALYFSEDEMLEFMPAFSEMYSDALLEAHEREVARLQALKQQRAPTLTLIDKHKGLIKDREELIASSQDSSRLMLRGQKGEKRDPGKLLREEKMRKRIAKELPKVTVEVKKALEQWEEEYERPFLVYGERYLDEIEMEEDTAAAAVKRPGSTRTRTPAGHAPASAAKAPRSAPSKANAATKSVPPPRPLIKTPATNGPTKRSKPQQPGLSSGSVVRGTTGSPSKALTRVPLSNLKNGINSPGRPKAKDDKEPKQPSQSNVERLRNGLPARAPPPKMRSLRSVPELNASTKHSLESSIVRAVEPEDVYDDRPARSSASLRSLDGSSNSYRLRPAPPPSFDQAPPRQASTTSHASTMMSGSENWETYDDDSEPEEDVSSTYYSKLRAARKKRMMTPEGGIRMVSPAKRVRGIPGCAAAVVVDEDGNRVPSCSEWDDTFEGGAMS